MFQTHFSILEEYSLICSRKSKIWTNKCETLKGACYIFMHSIAIDYSLRCNIMPLAKTHVGMKNFRALKQKIGKKTGRITLNLWLQSDVPWRWVHRMGWWPTFLRRCCHCGRSARQLFLKKDFTLIKFFLVGFCRGSGEKIKKSIRSKMCVSFVPGLFNK